jgi:hypothetical protein
MATIKLFAALVAVQLVGCSTLQPAQEPLAANVTPATSDQVGGCRYIDEMISVSSRYGVFASSALKDTKAEVVAKAAQSGATHLVWEAPVLAVGSTTSRGKAYRCS